MFNKLRLCGVPTVYIAGKFDRKLNFVVGVETAKLKSTNIILPATRNDEMHAVMNSTPST